MKSVIRIISFIFLLLPVATFAAGGGANLRHADIDTSDIKSLQNGARLYVNYCLGCHSLKHMRFNRFVDELDLTKEEIEQNLMFVGEKIFDYLNNTIPNEDAVGWFGIVPPDLTLTARSRGADWLYTYLTSFYADPGRPTGVNNLVFKDVGMPHVLWELQGIQDLTEDGKLVLREGSGSMDKASYDSEMLDLVNFMTYSAEPVKNERVRLGIWVIGFLLILLVISCFLKKEYWKDVH